MYRGELLQNADVRVSDNPPSSASVPFRGGVSLGFLEKSGKVGDDNVLVADKPLAGRYVVIINNANGKATWLPRVNVAEVIVFGKTAG